MVTTGTDISYTLDVLVKTPRRGSFGNA